MPYKDTKGNKDSKDDEKLIKVTEKKVVTVVYFWDIEADSEENYPLAKEMFLTLGSIKKESSTEDFEKKHNKEHKES